MIATAHIGLVKNRKRDCNEKTYLFVTSLDQILVIFRCKVIVTRHSEYLWKMMQVEFFSDHTWLRFRRCAAAAEAERTVAECGQTGGVWVWWNLDSTDGATVVIPTLATFRRAPLLCQRVVVHRRYQLSRLYWTNIATKCVTVNMVQLKNNETWPVVDYHVGDQ